MYSVVYKLKCMKNRFSPKQVERVTGINKIVNLFKEYHIEQSKIIQHENNPNTYFLPYILCGTIQGSNHTT